MRTDFIITEGKNNGYPTFNNAIEFSDLPIGIIKTDKGFQIKNGNYPTINNFNTPPQSPEITSRKRFVCSENLNNGYPTYLWSEDIKLGAFANAINLKNAIIPQSVEKIGSNSFFNTALTSVEITSDCEYSENSFPDNCQINFYE